MGIRGRRLAVAVLVILLLVQGPASLGMALGPVKVDQTSPTEVSPIGDTGSRALNDPESNSTGYARYYASLLTTAGTGTFANVPNELEVLDLDGDDQMEVAVNTEQGFVEVLRHPDYTMVWRSLEFPGGARAITTGDINGDGMDELVVGDAYGGVYVFDKGILEDPGAAPVVIGRLEHPQTIFSLGLIDLDHDDRKDIVVLSTTDCWMTLLRNVETNASGTAEGFALTLDVNISTLFIGNINALEIADIDGDGENEVLGMYYNQQDMVSKLHVINRSLAFSDDMADVGYITNLQVMNVDADPGIEILLNEERRVRVLRGSDLGFKWGIDTQYHEYLRGFQAGDFDNDGTCELITIEYNYDTNSWNISKIDVASLTYEWRENFTRMTPQVMASGDMDNDAIPELLMTNTLGLTAISIDSTPPNHTIEAVTKVIGFDAFGLGSLDWDDDGVTELLVGSKEGYLSYIDPFTGEMEAQAPKEEVNMASVVIEDLDNDQEVEILAGNQNKLLIMDRNLTYVNETVPDRYGGEADPEAKNPFTVADIDEDGWMEIIVGTDSNVVVLDGMTFEEENYNSHYHGHIRSMVAEDIDMDGVLDIIVGDTLSAITCYTGASLFLEQRVTHGYGPFGLDIDDVDQDGDKEIIVGDGYGYVSVYNGTEMFIERTSKDLGYELWGVKVHDLDGDGDKEILVGDGGGKVMALNGTTLEVEWETDLGNWVGTYNSLLVEDLDGDGHLEVAVGSDGFVYVLRLLLPDEKPDIEVQDIVFQGLPGKEVFEDGEEIEAMAHIEVTGHPLNASFEFYIEPADLNVTDRYMFASIRQHLGPGDHEIRANFTTTMGQWKVTVEADNDNRYSEIKETNNRAEAGIDIIESYAILERVVGQGTGLGRYGSMVIADDDDDGVQELIIGNSEGFVQTYHIEDGHGNKTITSFDVTRDLGTGPYGILMDDIDIDGEKELVASTGDGYVYSFRDVGKRLEWKTQVMEDACYGLDAADLDSDGDREVVVGCDHSKMFILDGESGVVVNEATLLYELWTLRTADVRGDGHLEIVVGAQDGTVHILNGTTLETVTYFRYGDVAIDDIEVYDVDRDGTLEIIWGDRSGSVFMVSLSHDDIDDEWYPVLEHIGSTGSPVKGIEVLDLMGQPGPEVLVGTEDSVQVLNGTLSKRTAFAIDGKLSGIVAGDIDRDGAPDVMVGTVKGDIFVLGMFQTGDQGTEVLEVTGAQLSIGPGFYGTAIGDLNGDMAPEMVLGTGSGELQVMDGVTGEMVGNLTGQDINLYGLQVADVDGDGQAELLTGSGEERVCALDGRTLIEEWCTQDLGDWAIAIAAADMDDDGDLEVAVGTGGRVHLLDGPTGEIEYSSYDLGTRILGLAAGNMDNDSMLEIAVGTTDGFLHIFDGLNLTKEWGLLLDSWPVGLALSDPDRDGIGNLFVGTEAMVYEISLLDREILWEYDLGQGVWGVVADDFDGDGGPEIFVGTRDGRVVAFNGTTREQRWASRLLGSRAGWYNSLEIKDVDWDGQKELMVGSSGYLYLFGAGSTEPVPVPDASVKDIVLPVEELVHGMEVNITAKVHNHGRAPMWNLTVHVLMDGKYLDSSLLSYQGPLQTQDVIFSVELEGGTHELSVVVDRYDTIEEYNEDNNNLSIEVTSLMQKNLAVIGGEAGIYFSAPPVKDIEVTVYALIENTGEELSDATVRFYWANLRLIGEDTVSVKGGQEVFAAINWTPPEAGERDITVMVVPWGGDGDDGDNVGSRTVHIMTYPSVSVGSVDLPSVILEQQECSIPVTIENRGEAETTGSLVLYLDGDEVWRTDNESRFPSGATRVYAKLMAEAGVHNLVFLLEEVAHDDIESDDWIEVNVTVVTRPDLMFDSVTNPPEKMLQDGRELVIGLVISNQGGAIANGTLKVYDNGAIFFETEISIQAGNMTTISVPWTATKGNHELEFRIVDVEPWEHETVNNKASLFLDITERPKEKGPNWPLLSLMVVGVLAPFIALVIYYSQVQPVRDMEALQARRVAGARNGRKGKKGKKRKKGRTKKVLGTTTPESTKKIARKPAKKVKKVEEQKDSDEKASK